MLVLFSAVIFTANFGATFSQRKPVYYEPTWKSLDARPLPAWYDDAKIGIFIHFGVYSVPSFHSEWFWYDWKYPGKTLPDVVEFMKKNYPPNFSYQDFAHELTMEFFNASEWIDLFDSAGAKYAVLTSKHHEGYTLWPSTYSFSWNSMAVGPKRDVVGEFVDAIRHLQKNGFNFHVGLYHSLFEWFNPLYLEDKAKNFSTRIYPKQKALPELYELVEKYKPDLIWSDGDAGPVEYWGSLDFLSWLYNESPVLESVVVNDRWGDGTSCHHGGYFNCADRYTPSNKQKHKWENALTLDKNSWGYRRNAKINEYLSQKELIAMLVKTIAGGGNFLVDVGPTKEGTIPVIMQERLFQMGKWLKINGEAIYGSRPWESYNDSANSNVFYTTSSKKKETFVYAIFLEWPINNVIVLSEPATNASTKITLLGETESNLEWKQLHGSHKISVVLPNPAETIRDATCCAWTLKISNVLKISK